MGNLHGGGPVWLVLLLTCAGFGVGELLRRQLSTGAYRLESEQHHRMLPGSWCLPAGTATSWALLTWRHGGELGGARLPAYLFLAVVGIAGTWVDLDVHRLPEGLTLPAYPLLLLLLIPPVIAGERWTSIPLALGCMLGSWLLLVLWGLLARGGLGWGDSTLAGLIGLALGGHGPRAPATAIGAGLALGAVTAAVLLLSRKRSRHSEIAFGPYLVAGALVAALM